MTKIFHDFDISDFWVNDKYAQENYIGETLTDVLVGSLEKELGYTFPSSYIELMKHQNGGIPAKMNHRMKEPTSWAENYITIAGILGINRSKPNSLGGRFGNNFWINKLGYPPIGIYVCDCPSAGHDMVCLDYRQCGPQGEPQVVHVDQEFDYKITFVTDNFEAFIRGLEGKEAFN